jgi:hypothetical protein
MASENRTSESGTNDRNGNLIVHPSRVDEKDKRDRRKERKSRSDASTGVEIIRTMARWLSLPCNNEDIEKAGAGS